VPIYSPTASEQWSQCISTIIPTNKLSDATPTSLSVTGSSQGKGAIRDFGKFNSPHTAQKMRKWTIISKEQDDKMHRYARQFMFKDAPSAAPTETVTENVTNTTPQWKRPVRLGWGTPHHNVGIDLPSHPNYVAPNPAAHEPTHISPPEVAAKPLSKYCSEASNSDNNFYDFAEVGFY
jgi:hypothetical protein